MTKITQGFARELPTLLESVTTDAAQMIMTEFRITYDVDDVRPLQELLSELSPGAVCCRSKFVKQACGVGGMLIPVPIAQALTHAMLMMESPTEDDEFDWDGLVGEAMAEFWNIIVGSWTKVATPDYRMSGATDECSVELYPSHFEFPGENGVFPDALVVEMSLGDITARGAVFLPLRTTQGSAFAGYEPPNNFLRVTCTETLGGGAPGASRDAAGEAPAVRAALAQAAQPVVFLDYSGLVLPWIRQRVADQRLQYLLSEKLDSDPLRDPEAAPVAAVLAGVDLNLLEELTGCAFVEIRPRDE